MTEASPRRRLTRQARRTQLLAVAREIIRVEGADALTLGHVAERAHITKPVVYDHFGDRSGLLAELYREFDARQHAMLDASLEHAAEQIDDVARIVATTYVECSLAEGRELAGVVAALAGSPSLEQLRQETVDAYITKCRRALAPYAPAESLRTVNFRAVVAAGDALVRSVTDGEITHEEASATLTRLVMATAAM